MSELWPVFGTLAGGIVAGLVTLVVKRWDRKDAKSDAAQQAIAAADARAQAFIDQVQEQYREDRMEWARERTTLHDTWKNEREALQARQERAEARIENAEMVIRMLLDYASQLRHHIETKADPPPPPYPAGWPK